MIGAQEEQLTAERGGVDPGKAGEFEGAPGPEPVRAIAFGIEIAVPDEKAVADLEVLAARGQVERILAQGFGQERARAPAAIERLETELLVAAIGEAASIAVADRKRADAGGAAVERAGSAAVLQAEAGLDVALAPLRVAGDVAVRQIDPAQAEVGVLGQQAAHARLDVEAEREPVPLEQLHGSGRARPCQYQGHGESAHPPRRAVLHR